MPDRGILTSWPIRKKLLLLTLVVFLPAAGIIIASGVEQRGHEISEAKDNARLLVQSLVAQQEQIAVGIEQMLSTLAQLPQVQRLDTVACNEIFRQLLDRHPFYSTIGATTPDGTLFASSTPFDPGAINLSDRKHIKDTIGSLDFSVGEYQVGRVNKVQSINYSYPALDADKNLIAVVNAGFKLDEYAGFIKKANLPEGSAVVINDHKGVRLYRVPENDAAALGKPPTGGFEHIEDLDEGFYERTADDGIFRIYAFKRLHLREGSPPYLNMIVGIPRDKILHEANLKMLNNLLILVLAAFVAMSLAWLLGNVTLIEPINKLVTATQRLGGGETGAQTGLLHTHDELGRLAKSFDDMASLLEAKDIERKRAQEALVESEARYRAVVEDQTELITRFSPDGVVAFVNKANCRYFGLREDEFVGDTFWHCVPEEDHDMIKEHIGSLNAEQPTGMIEHRVVTANGEIRWLQWVNRAIFDAQGQIVEYQGVGRDITDLKLAQETLLKTTQRLQLAVTSGHMGIWEWDIGSGELTWDDGMLSLYGIARESFPMHVKAWETALHPDDIAESKGAVQAALRGEKEYDAEFRIVRPDGTIRVLQANGLVIRDEDGKPVRMIGLNRDITQRKATEEALKKTGNELSTIFNSVPATIWYKDTKNNFIRVNKAGADLVGMRAEDIEGKAADELFPIYAEKYYSDDMEVIRSDRPKLGIVEVVRNQAGEIRWVQTDKLPMRNADGEVTGILVLAIDITKREQALDALRESEEKYRSLAETSADYIMRYDRGGRHLYVNPACAGMTGVPVEEFIGKTHREMGFAPELSRVWEEKIRDVFETGEPRQWEFEFEGTKGRTYLDWRVVPEFKDGKVEAVLGVSRDITERVQAEEMVRKSEKELRSLSTRLLSAQEEERRRIAGDIHDSLGSSLSAVKIALENARSRMADERMAAGVFDVPITWTKYAIDEARRLMTDLRPSMLDDLGLLETISWFLRQFRSVHPNIHIEEEIGIEESGIPETLRIVIFRIIQEAFNNTAKYSNAEYLNFSLLHGDHEIELLIEDNGDGFDLDDALAGRDNGRGGLGLTSMKERAELSGGAFSISSVRGEGTTIRASWSS